MATEAAGDPAVRDLVGQVVAASGVGGVVESVSAGPLFEFDRVQVDVARRLGIGRRGTRAVWRRWRCAWP